MVDTTDKPKAEPKQHRLEHARWGLAEHKKQHWIIEAEQGVTVAVLEDESYWANMASKMKPWDTLEVRTDDGALWVEGLVLSCGRNYAKIHILRAVKLQTTDVEQSQVSQRNTALTFVWKHRGPRKHSIVRSDGQIMHEGADTKDQAVQWATDNGIKLAKAIEPA